MEGNKLRKLGNHFALVGRCKRVTRLQGGLNNFALSGLSQGELYDLYQALLMNEVQPTVRSIVKLIRDSGVLGIDPFGPPFSASDREFFENIKK